MNSRDEARLEIQKDKASCRLHAEYMLNGTIRFLLGEFAGFTCQ